MKILFITLLDLSNLDESGIYHDLVKELANQGNEITIVSAKEKRHKGETQVINYKNIKNLSVKINDITKTSFIKKGINTLLIEKIYEKAIKRFLVNSEFDLIIYTTPPITFYNLIKKLKNKYNAQTYLLLKDIFPQNAVDLNLFTKRSIIYKIFRLKEKNLYEISDYIGCMSKQNINYIKRNNNIIAKVQQFRNALYEKDYTINQVCKKELISKYGIDENKRLFLYGGNLGLPQGIEFIKQIMARFNEVGNAQLLIVGNGTHFNEIYEFCETLNYSNVRVLNAMPKEEYDRLIPICDVGLIFLDSRFTIPNYPSRLTSLLNARKPILIATDDNTDIKDDILNYKCGLWSKSDDVDLFIQNAKRLSTNDLTDYQNNAYRMFDSEFRIEKNVANLLRIIQ